jgi:hypothetical protein
MARPNVKTVKCANIARSPAPLRTPLLATWRMATAALFCVAIANAQPSLKSTHDTRRMTPTAESASATKKTSTPSKVAAKQPTVKIDLDEARRRAAKRAIAAASATMAPAPYADTYTPAYAPLTTNANVNANAALRARASAIELSNLSRRAPSANTSFAQPAASYSVILTPTSIDAHVLRNIYEPIAAPRIEMGDRPPRGTSLCGDGRLRRFGDLDMKAFAQTLPDFNVARPRTVCVRRGVLMADYFFK